MESLGGLLFPLLILLLFVPIFLSGRKQRRQVQEMSSLQSSLEVGDVVTTTSGLRGTVVDVQYEETVDLEIADNVVTTWLRAAVRDRVVSADSPVDHVDDTDDAADPADDLADPADTAADRPAVDRPAADRPAVDRPAAGHGATRAVIEPADTPSDANGTARP